MNQNACWLGIAIGCSMGGWGWLSSAYGQIVPDSTLPVNSIVTPQNNTLQIDGGTAAGGNLFHSFQDFSLPTGSEAFFNNAPTVENIITRVTGGNISNIDGLIRANGTANLFLLNPNGIVFGANARLDIGGSFVGSTADRVVFTDGSFFSATDTAATPPLLTINVPIGLQFGAEPGGIRVEGEGHNMRFEGKNGSLTNPERFVRERPIGLRVFPDRTLALVGGEIVLDGGSLTAAGDPISSGSPRVPGGRIELGSVAGNNTVTLTPIARGWTLEYDGIQDFQDIRLTHKASLDASGSRAGTIRVWGRSLSLQGGSTMLAWTLAGGMPVESDLSSVESIGIFARVSDTIEVSGEGSVTNTSGTPKKFSSHLLAEVEDGAMADGGNITLQADRLEVVNEGIISSGTRGSRRSGDIIIRTADMAIAGDSKVQAQAIVGSGEGGNIEIWTDRLRVYKEGRIAVSTFSDGNAGNLTIHARESIDVTDRSSAIRATSAMHEDASVTPTGNGGQLTIETDRLRVTEAASISTTTQTAGDAGSIVIRAREIEVRNHGAARPSRIAAQVNPDAEGRGGEISIETDRLLVSSETNGEAIIAVTTQSSQNAGHLEIYADTIELMGEGSRLEAQAEQREDLPSGAPGNIYINSERLFIRDRAKISVENQGTNIENVGNIQLDVADLRLLNGGSIITQAGLDRNGNPITIDGTPIRSNGGNITIETDTLTALENSDIIANAQNARGGDIAITTQGIFGTEKRDFNTPESDITASGANNLNGTISIQTPDVDPTNGVLQLPETPIDAESLIGQDACSRGAGSEFFNSGVGGVPPTPDVALWEPEGSVGLVEFPPDLESISPEPHQSSEVAAEPHRLVEAQGWYVDAQGRVILTANAPTVTPQGIVWGRSSCDRLSSRDRS